MSRRGYQRHDEEIRAAAYGVWAWEQGRSMSATALQLDVPERTLRHWTRVDGWRQRHLQERLAATPADIVPVVVGTLAAAAVDAAEYFASIMAGEREPSKELTAVAVAALDRAGFGVARLLEPMRMEGDDNRGRGELTDEELRAMTPAQLRALEQGRSVGVSTRANHAKIEVVTA